MKAIVLDHPRIRSEKHFNDIANTPLWSCLMAGYASASIRRLVSEVRLMDANRHGWTFEHTAREVIDVSPDLLCVNAVYFWEHTHRLFDFFRGLRSAGFPGHLNLFGFFPTMAWRAILDSTRWVDSIAVGECETTLAELADCLKTGREWSSIPGLARRHGGGARMAAPRPPEKDPDGLPVPERLPSDGGTVSILASRGCYNHCRFCPVPVFYNGGPMWRGRSPENVVREITSLTRKGARDFYFVDPNFIGPGRRGKRRTMDLCRMLEPLNIRFGMETRAGDVDTDVMAALKSAGLNSLLIGVESGSSAVLQSLNKGASIHSGEQAIALCREVGIEPEIGFLMFTPDGAVEDLEQNLDFLIRNRLLDRLDRTANLLGHRQLVFMGTSGYRRFKEQGRLAETGFSGFQADVEYLDPRVRALSDVMIHACLFVLSETGKPDSPLFWKANPGWKKARGVNGWLVDLFKRLIAECKGKNGIFAMEKTKKTARNELRALIERL